MDNFTSWGLAAPLLTAIQTMFSTPTMIQSRTVPEALEGRDMLASAQTGTGKTAAYSIPLVNHLLINPQSMALVLMPTRDLANQVLKAIKDMVGVGKSIRTALLIGDDPFPVQLRQLRSSPRIIVGTPGRIGDHLKRGNLKLDRVDFFVLDETDRLLDMGFSAQLASIVACLPAERQTLMFSATMAPSIVKAAKHYLRRDALRVSVGSTSSPHANIQQEVVRTSEPKKYELLIKQLNELQDKFCIVFVKTKRRADELSFKLRTQGYSADALHGDLRQRQRERVIRDFREGRCSVLVATDVAARGLDIPSISCVINYDLPQSPEDYIHRIGRTGRAGAKGTAVSLVTAQDNIKWKNIRKLMDSEVQSVA